MKEQEIEVMIPSIQTVKTYRYDELPEESKEIIRDKWRDGDRYDWSDETASMEAIADELDCDLRYEQDAWGYWYVRLDPCFNEEAVELKGVRALAYIENNFITPNEKGKYISNGWCGERNRSYYSKCTMQFDCPFTGFCMDYDMYAAYEKFKGELRKNQSITVSDYIEYVEAELKTSLDGQEDGMQSDEYADEEIEANWDDRWYTIDGEDVTDRIA